MTRRTERDEVLEAPEIPLDLQFEILKKLPVKSLARFKCVSKLWSSLIHSQGYLFPSSPPRLYIKSVQGPGKYALLSLASTAFDLDMMIHGIEGYIISAIRGLILCYFYGQAYIYNPTTGQRVTLPHPNKILPEKEEIKHDDYFFGYDPILDQYKVLLTANVWSEKLQRTYPKHCVFVLEAGSSWKTIEFDHPHLAMNQELCIDGVIYYLAHSDVARGFNIISFDVRSEEFNIIQLPHPMSVSVHDVGFIEYDGKPTLFDSIHLRNSLVNLWVLEDVGTWSNKSLVLQSCQMHFFPSNIRFRVIGTTQNGEVVLEPVCISSPYYILYYDLHKNDVRRVDIKRISKEPFDLVLMDTGENIVHLKI